MQNIKIDEGYLTSPPASHSSASLPEQLGTLLDSWALRARTSKTCARCGSRLEEIAATFFTLESDCSWEIPLRFCSECDAKAENLLTHLV